MWNKISTVRFTSIQIGHTLTSIERKPDIAATEDGHQSQRYQFIKGSKEAKLWKSGSAPNVVCELARIYEVQLLGTLRKVWNSYGRQASSQSDMNN